MQFMPTQLQSLLPLVLLALPLQAASSQLASSRIYQGIKKHEGGGRPAAKDCPSVSAGLNTYKTRFPGVTWDQNDWALSTTVLDQGHYEARGSIANGYLGINVASVGPFFEFDRPVDGDVINGWPLFDRRLSFATISGFWDEQPTTNGSNFPWLYQYGGESVISGVPHWSGLVLDLGNGAYLDATVDSSTVSDYRTTFDFKSGVLSWSYRWTPAVAGGGSFQITYRLFAHKLYVNEAIVDLEVTASKECKASIVNVIDGASAVRTDFVESGQEAGGAIYTAVRPWGVANVTAYIYAAIAASETVDTRSPRLVKDKPYLNGNESSIAESYDVHFTPGKSVRITKFVGGASSDAFSDPKQTARQACMAAREAGYGARLRSHVAEWASVLPENSVDDFTFAGNGSLPDDEYIIESQIISVTSTYYLLQNTVGSNALNKSASTALNKDSIAVGGLTSDSYAGLIFWDADVWMQPGLVASHPEAAQRTTNYRADRYLQARANVKTAYQGSKDGFDFSTDAAIYSWTSGRYGNCTATGPCWDYEYHLNGDIGLSIINQYVASGDNAAFKEKLFPIYDSVATLFSDIVQPNGSYWTLTNMTDPDEYANHVDAGGYTMPLIAQTLMYANSFRQQFGLEENKTWDQIAKNVLVIHENGVTLEFTTMNGSAVVKQADVVLDTYPLDYTHNYTAVEALNDLDYYANKQSPDGPAMTWAIFSVVASQISPSGCSAYTYAQYAYMPYTRAPFFQLSEMMVDDASVNGGTHPAFPFLTGHGGALQVNLFGYLGFRYLPDLVIHIDPNLPPQIPHITYRTFFWRGWPLTAASNFTHTTLRRAWDVSPLSTADARFAHAPITVHVGLDSNNATVYQLPVNGTLTVRNRMIGAQNTVADNMAQCQPVHSADPYQPGQFPISVADGATSTKWQPLSSANTSSVTISLPLSVAGQSVYGFYFNWAQSPPVSAAVLFHDSALSPGVVSNFTFNNGSSASPSNKPYNTVSVIEHVALSAPYNASLADIIAVPIGNTTNVTLPSPVPAPRYATLIVQGNQANSAAEVAAKNGPGATVAEWAILGANGTTMPSPHQHQTRQRMSVSSRAALERAVRQATNEERR